jgi:hypothetical protein
MARVLTDLSETGSHPTESLRAHRVVEDLVRSSLQCGNLSWLRSARGLVSRVSPVQTALRNCTRDEGRSFEVGNQGLISSHRKLL